MTRGRLMRQPSIGPLQSERLLGYVRDPWAMKFVYCCGSSSLGLSMGSPSLSHQTEP